MVVVGYNTNMIVLTDKATTKVAQLITEEEDTGLFLRVGVRPGGCSGFSYDMYFDSDLADFGLNRS